MEHHVHTVDGRAVTGPDGLGILFEDATHATFVPELGVHMDDFRTEAVDSRDVAPPPFG